MRNQKTDLTIGVTNEVIQLKLLWCSMNLYSEDKNKLARLITASNILVKNSGLDNQQASHGVIRRVKGKVSYCFEMLMGLCVGE